MTLPERVPTTQVNAYLAHKQHLARDEAGGGVEQITGAIVALHATSAPSPYLSLWARMAHFERGMLEAALYDGRSLVKVLCMRATLHTVPSDEISLFVEACRGIIDKRTPPRFRNEGLLVQTGVCDETEAKSRWSELHQQILEVLARQGPATVPEITAEVPVLQAKIHHDPGTRYAGSFSIGTRVVYAMCAQGLLVRTRIRGSWRSSLYEYAPLAEWLPDADLTAVDRRQAQTWLVHRYLAAFGPATADDAQWWTGFTKTDIRRALRELQHEAVEIEIEGLGHGFLMLSNDLDRLHAHESPAVEIALLPELDPYIMGYRDRRRFLEPAHAAKLLDRAGNAVPTVWAAGRIVGAWGQRQDGTVVTRLLGRLTTAEQALLGRETEALTEFLDGEYLPPRYGTAFTKERDAFQ